MRRLNTLLLTHIRQGMSRRGVQDKVTQKSAAMHLSYTCYASNTLRYLKCTCTGFGGRGGCCATLPAAGTLPWLAKLADELASLEVIVAGAVALDTRLGASEAAWPFACTCRAQLT